MPAEIDSIAYSKAKPWHGLGTYLGEELFNAETAIKEGGLNWEVQVYPLPCFPEGERVETEHFAVIRKDRMTSLGVVGKRYKAIQNRECFSFFDGLVEEGAALYETVGALYGGKKVWLLAKLPGDSVIRHVSSKEDIQEKYIAIVNSHDGKGSLLSYFTSVRVVCANTLRMSFSDATDKVSIRHTTNAVEKLQQAKDVMDLSTKYYEEVGKWEQFLAGKPIRSGEAISYFAKVFPKKDIGAWKADKLRNQVAENFEQEVDKFGADWFSALNAVTGVIDHSEVVAGRGDRRMDSSWFGKGMEIKDRAMDTALELSRV